MPCCARITAIIMILLLSGCSTYVDHLREMKACRLKCSGIQKRCEHACRNNCQNCNVLSNTETAVHFNHYKHQQNIQGSIVALELQSFRDPLQCRKPTCDCKVDFGVCLQSCRGKIRKRLKVVQPC